MKSRLLSLLAVLLAECGRKGGAPCDRDVKTLRSRVEHEGDSFITITLPKFCVDFERSLAEGRVGPGLFLSFRKEASGIPSFLKGFLSKVFDTEGCLLNEPSVDCIRFVRQICLFGKKVELPCSSARVQDAIDRFVQCDNEVIVVPPDTQVYRYFKRVSTIVLSALFEGDDFRSSVKPRHGPGATKERISGNQKWVFRTWHRRLSEVGFAYFKYGRGTYSGLLPCKTHRIADERWPDLVEPEDEAPSRVCLVPKTLKTPRVIAVEPVCMQYAQQALSRWIVRRLESCRFTAGHVNFRDQTVNQSTAKAASVVGHLATIDMAEASDRVSIAHVQDMLASVPDFREWVFASRSTRAQLPNGDLITLKKFASMGSALCFPMEAMVFFMIIVASRIRRAGRFPTACLVKEFSRDVYVYGDDLIVPADEAPAICEDLESLGLKVNGRKSFWTGKFRESCGTDWYQGALVTPVYLRKPVPSDRRDVSGLLSAIATMNQLYSAGFVVASKSLRKTLERVLGPLFLVPVDSPAVGSNHYSEVVPPRRWNKNLQRHEYLCLVPVPSRVDDPLEGYPALLKTQMKGSDSLSDFESESNVGLAGIEALARCLSVFEPVGSTPEDHLETSPRPYGLALKRRWVPLI